MHLDFETYQHLAMRTTDDTPSDDLRAYQLIHGVSGLVGELNELLQSATFDRLERGDVWWYLARISRALGKPYTGLTMKGSLSDAPLASRREAVSRCFQRSLIMLEMAKKVYFQCHDIERYAEDLFVMAQSTASTMSSIDDDLEDTWRANVHKLQERYPDGVFDREASMNRTG